MERRSAVRVERVAAHLSGGAGDAAAVGAAAVAGSAVQRAAAAVASAATAAASGSKEKAPKRVLVTGAAGQIAYSLVFLVASGKMLGEDQPLVVHLLDIPAAQSALNAVVMELMDCAFPLLRGVVPTTDLQVAFSDVDVALLVGSRPRGPGMERKDLLAANVGIFREQGRALERYASRNVKVCVVGNPANTNCLVALTNAPSIPRENFSALTRLDQNRASAQIAQRAGVLVTQVQNVVVWGNHSATQFADAAHATIGGRPATDVIKDTAWLQGDFVKTVQQRGAAVIAARKASSAASAAKAIVDHVHDWLLGTPRGAIVSMAVASDGSYGIDRNLVFSFPVTCANGTYQIVRHLRCDAFAVKMLQATEKELLTERDDAYAATNTK